jgi:2-oxoglutarate ferredoxin oxidoreductase subunit gamma
MNQLIVIAGFGGQGILFAGKIIAYAGLLDGNEVSWLPSYGPEMRGGTANCSITISNEPVGSPLIVNPATLVAMNNPSLEKFVDFVVPNGMIVIDNSLIESNITRTDVKVISIPATSLANENELKGFANLIILGKLFKEAPFSTYESLEVAIKKSIPAKRADLFEKNMKAIKIGLEY